MQRNDMSQPTTVLLAIDAPDVCDEIVHALDRSGVARVVATAADPRQVAEATRQLEPDLVIAEPRLAAAAPDGAPCLTVASRESVAALRAAIDAGADGFFVWPVERDALVEHVGRLRAGPQRFDRRALVIAVHASRGGAGCTFLATHLARAVVQRERSCLLLDVDPDGNDAGTALGLAEDPDNAHRLDAIARVVDELTPEAFNEAVWRHGSGIGVVPAPAATEETPTIADVERVVDLAAAATDVVVLHLARGLDPGTRRWLEIADLVLEVVALDIASLRGSTRTMAKLGVELGDVRWQLVVNRAARSEVVPSDVERVFGRQALAVVPADAGVPRAQDRGELLTRRSRAARVIARLAGDLGSAGIARGAA
jgi:Flp pilus assembly CpaE family ATPase